MKKLKNKSKKKIIAIEWIDSAGPEGWVLGDCKFVSSCKCLTIGFLLFENESDFVVSSTVGIPGKDNQAYAPLAISKKCVTRFKIL